ncbi:MAG: T9SS type A sorting domain-containing protein [Lentimicrobium sp.]|nr:T9SS type A sorting domain-containing protein [Lentimicrobium sp.]
MYRFNRANTQNTWVRRFILGAFLLLAALPLFSQEVVEVGGTLTENETWTNDYTYVVTGDLLVPEGLELIIMPGVRVRFHPNTGLFVNLGMIKVLGSYEDVIDTVRFESFEGQLWKGISIIAASGLYSNIIDHASIDRADIGIDIRSCTEVVIRNCRIQNGTTNDLRLYNSSGCLIQHNYFSDNGRVSLEIYSTGTGNQSSENHVEHNLISESRYTNLMVRFENSGVCLNNKIENNVIQGAEAGIFIDNSNLNNNDVILIRGNVFIGNGNETFGFGISTGMDSTIIRDNIFWQNRTSLEFRRGKNSMIDHNSFYQNTNNILVKPTARKSDFTGNTFTGNVNYLAEFNDATEKVFQGNNIFNNNLLNGIVRNNTSADINVAGQYWGTSDTALIEAYLWDKQDEPALGKLAYHPYVTEVDTTAPVSPPNSLIKQLANGRIKLSWNKNPEEDLAGYAVYQGAFRNYRFSAAPITTADTFIFIPGSRIEQEFGVTAFDRGGSGFEQQRTGHESPFAFAVLMPYAGPDTVVCSNVPFFTITQSNVPFSFEQLTWFTEGDGQFSNPAILSPNYLPGVGDLVRGYVRLGFTVISNDEEFTDDFLLTFNTTPEVYAGKDRAIPLSPAYKIENAEALYFEQLQWSGLGDGSFDNPAQLYPTYTFGGDDLLKGMVQLILTASSPCGVISDTVTLFIRNLYSVEGKVLADGVAVPGAAVLAVTAIADPVMEVVGLAKTDQEGNYRFDALYAADYRFYALPDTTDPEGFMPAYYAGKDKWRFAYKLPLVANTYHVEIELTKQPVSLPSGLASISGRFELPASLTGLNNYCSPWFSDSHALYCDGGLSNVTILLYNDRYNIPMDYTITDNEGRFSFNELPYGKYIIDAEKSGFETTVSSHIELNREVPVRDDVLLRIGSNLKIEIFVPEKPENRRSLVYPNPADEFLFLNIETSDEPIDQIEIYNAFGQCVINANSNDFQRSSSGEFMLNTSNLTGGIYLGRCISGTRVKTFNFIIKH